MINIVNENIFTDLKKNGIQLTGDMFDAINEFVDIQNSSATQIYPDSWRDIKDKTVLLTSDGEIKAVYSDGRFMFNPDKIKISNATNYDVYEINVAGVDVQRRRDQRRYARQGLVTPSEVDYSKVPKSTQYIWDKDWDPEVNREYYAKLLQRKHLGQYADKLSEAYDVIIELINQRKDRPAGKRMQYNDFIFRLSTQIKKIEELIVGAEISDTFDADAIKKQVAKLPAIIDKAEEFMGFEAAEYSRFGRRRPEPLTPLER